MSRWTNIPKDSKMSLQKKEFPKSVFSDAGKNIKSASERRSFVGIFVGILPYDEFYSIISVKVADATSTTLLFLPVPNYPIN